MIIKCPKCNSEIEIDNEQKEVQCKACGNNINSKVIKNAKNEVLNYSFELLCEQIKKKDLKEAEMILNNKISLNGNQIDKALLLVLKVFKAESAYINEANDLVRDVRVKNSMSNTVRKIFLGADNYDRSPIHGNYLNEVIDLTKQLKELSEILFDTNKNEINKIVEILVGDLLKVDESVPTHIAYVFCADDYCCFDLIKYLDINYLHELYLDYGSFERQRSVFPNQLKLIREMEKILTEHNIELPVRPKKEKFKDFFKIIKK